ncbi:hypothetical protein [Pseudonocardia nigra]|uniref:hypothetical protein n=1 Tax=Pseudonocardia nigra TaxID=1921578 RepID=UPI001C5E7478|nr:hypothetical protein [Pseudonocardia nigra]
MSDNIDTSDDYDAVTARDIAEFLHHLAELRRGPGGPDPAGRTAFLTRKAELFTRIADQSDHSHRNGYSEQARQIADNARAAAGPAHPELPRQRVGPNPRRTSDIEPGQGGATSQEKSGASSD